MGLMKNAMTVLMVLAALVFSCAAVSRAAEQFKGAGAADMDELDKAIEKEMKAKPKEPEKPKKPLPPFNMVYIKGGCFSMGDWTGEGDDDELPAHEVCVGDFYIGETEVTLGLAEAVMGVDIKDLDPNKPITNVTWKYANMIIKELNARTKRFYRLPTEAEWEYAAREGGRRTRWAGVDSEDELSAYAWFEENSDGDVHPVKTRKPNRLGLYDMAGNAAEWTEDLFDFDYYKTSPKKNPTGAEWSSWRTVRGGSYVDKAFKLRTTFRYATEPQRKYHIIGLRLAE